MATRITAFGLLVLLGLSASGASGDPDAIVGQWLTSEQDCRVEIAKAGDKYNGKIVWLKEPNYPKDDREAGKPIHDRENPDPAKRDQPLVGLTLLSGFEYTADNSWTGGTIYNPDNGKSYKGQLSLNKDGTLKVRGYIGVPLLGGSTTWTRYDKPGKAEEKK